MRLDPSLYQDLMLSILPELVLTAWSLILLLFVAWRHETIRDLRLAGWLTFAALVSTAAATWWLWWNRASVQGTCVVTMIAADDFRWVAPDALASLGDLKLTGGLEEVIQSAHRLIVP